MAVQKETQISAEDRILTAKEEAEGELRRGIREFNSALKWISIDIDDARRYANKGQIYSSTGRNIALQAVALEAAAVKVEVSRGILLAFGMDAEGIAEIEKQIAEGVE